MHPLSIFPQLLFLGLIAPLLLRVTVGLFILSLGWENYKKPSKWTTIFYAVSGILLVLGLYTQIAALVGIIIIKTDFWINKKTRMFSKNEMILYVMAVIILLSLLFTGPGFLAFDLPL